MNRTLTRLALLLTLLAPAPLQAQEAPPSLRQVRQRIDYAIDRARNTIDEMEALIGHLWLSRTGVHAAIVADSIAFLPPVIGVPVDSVEPEPEPVDTVVVQPVPPDTFVADTTAVVDMPLIIRTSGTTLQTIVVSTPEADAASIDPASVMIGTADGMFPAARGSRGILRTVSNYQGLPVVYYYLGLANLGGTLPDTAAIVLTANHPTAGAIRANSEVPLPTGAVVVAPPTPTEPFVPTPLPDPAGPYPAPASAFVQFPSAEVAAILSPQLVNNSGYNPWPWFDENALSHGLTIGAQYVVGDPPRIDGNSQYYDQGLVQYLNYYRTGDERYLELARTITDEWFLRMEYDRSKGWGSSPRGASAGGMFLRALDGRPDYWPFLTTWTRSMFQMWLGARSTYPELYFGVRDGGYMLLYAAYLAQVHPDEAVRAEFREKAVAITDDYFLRLQSDNGGWFWRDGSDPWEQPFMVGLLLDGLIEVHQITGDPEVLASILASVEHLAGNLMTDTVAEPRGQGVTWRAVPYFIYPDGTIQGETALAGGWDTNTIREARQRNSLVVHAFGYAYHVTKDPKYRAWGDNLFAATYGRGRGPGSDPFYGLADFRAKEYNQAYRTAGKYLAWRLD